MANREKFWSFWRAYYKPLGIDPYLEGFDFQTKTKVTTGFVGCVRKVSHCRGKHVKDGTVCASLRGFNAKIDLDTGQQPLHQSRLNDKYILPLQHMLKGFEVKDPPRVKNLVVHPDFPGWI